MQRLDDKVLVYQHHRGQRYTLPRDVRGEFEPAIHYITLDDLNFYVGTGGNYRTCIARLFLAKQQKNQLHDATLSHRFLNTGDLTLLTDPA
ncbi:hypothetical protein JEV30_23625 [Pseudomonas aeruginosa]|nr:hypothetical protein [Pseudomonas aeruginosa]